MKKEFFYIFDYVKFQIFDMLVRLFFINIMGELLVFLFMLQMTSLQFVVVNYFFSVFGLFVRELEFSVEFKVRIFVIDIVIW